MNITDTLARADAAAAELLRERDRLVRERREFLLGAALTSGPIFGDPFNFKARADSALALIEAIERHVGNALPALEERARAGDAAAAEKAFATTNKILAAVRGVKVEGDFVDDARELVEGIERDASIAVGAGIGLGAVALVAWVLFGGRR